MIPAMRRVTSLTEGERLDLPEGGGWGARQAASASGSCPNARIHAAKPWRRRIPRPGRVVASADRTAARSFS